MSLLRHPFLDYANVDMGDGDAGTAFSTQDRAKLRSREEAGQDRDTESMDLAVITAVMCEGMQDMNEDSLLRG